MKGGANRVNHELKGNKRPVAEEERYFIFIVFLFLMIT